MSIAGAASALQVIERERLTDLGAPPRKPSVQRLLELLFGQEAMFDIDSVNHVAIAVRNLDAASALYERLGFQLTPLSVHSGSSEPGGPTKPLATGNRCAVFPNNYVELLGVVDPNAPNWGLEMDRLAHLFEGAHGLCFGSNNPTATEQRLNAAEVQNSGILSLQRDIETPEGWRTARFDCVLFDSSLTPEGLVQAAYHHNPEYVHQPRYLAHPNGAVDLCEVLIVAADPVQAAARFALHTGHAVQDVDGLKAIKFPRASLVKFADAETVAGRFHGTLLSPVPSITAATFTVSDLEEARKLMVAAGFRIVQGDNRFHIPAEDALGLVHEFVTSNT